jgi:molybdate transport system ATP-binding protein
MSVEFSATKRLARFSYDATFSAANELLVLFGPSGAGKSLTLQFAAGLMRPDWGSIALEGRTVFDAARGISIAPQRRRIGYVVQELALFPHMTVAQNVAFGMERPRSHARVDELLVLLGLEGFAARKPASLSGGQQQRVALARALAREARVLLLDEPFSALDESLRQSLRRELLRLRRELGLTILFVTHDLREAHLLADRIAVFDDGRILQLAPREDVFRRPVSRRVAELTGVANVLPGRVVGQAPGTLDVEIEGLVLRCAANGPTRLGAPVEVAIRAERVVLRRVSHEEGRLDNRLTASIVSEDAYGNSHGLRLVPDGPGPAVWAELASRPYDVLGIAAEKRWTVELPPEDLHVMVPSP